MTFAGASKRKIAAESSVASAKDAAAANQPPKEAEAPPLGPQSPADRIIIPGTFVSPTKKNIFFVFVLSNVFLEFCHSQPLKVSI